MLAGLHAILVRLHHLELLGDVLQRRQLRVRLEHLALQLDGHLLVFLQRQLQVVNLLLEVRPQILQVVVQPLDLRVLLLPLVLQCLGHLVQVLLVVGVEALDLDNELLLTLLVLRKQTFYALKIGSFLRRDPLLLHFQLVEESVLLVLELQCVAVLQLLQFALVCVAERFYLLDEFALLLLECDCMALLVVFELSCESLLLLQHGFTVLVGDGLQLRNKFLLLLLESVYIAEFELRDLVPVPLFLSLELLSIPPVKSLKLV